MAIKARLAAMGITSALVMAGAFIYPYEGEVKQVYKDPVGILTACIGHVDQTLRLGQYFSEKQCTELYAQDLIAAQRVVHRCIGRDLPEKTEAAFISFALNTGAGNVCPSTLAKLAKAGKLKEACQQLPLWVYAGKTKLPGLVRRRNDELRLCLEGVYETVPSNRGSTP